MIMNNEFVWGTKDHAKGTQRRRWCGRNSNCAPATRRVWRATTDETYEKEEEDLIWKKWSMYCKSIVC